MGNGLACWSPRLDSGNALQLRLSYQQAPDNTSPRKTKTQMPTRPFSRITFSVLWLLPTACTPLGATAQDPSPQNGSCVQETAPIPATAPDSVPADLWANMEYSTALDFVIIEFRPFTSVDERRRVIASVCGTVAGGMRRQAPEEGYYIIRVPKRDSAMSMLSLADKMLAIPSVAWANALSRLYPSSSRL